MIAHRAGLPIEGRARERGALVANFSVFRIHEVIDRVYFFANCGLVVLASGGDPRRSDSRARTNAMVAIIAKVFVVLLALRGPIRIVGSV